MADEFPRFRQAGVQQNPAEPNISQLQAPFRAGEEALGVAQRAVNLGAEFIARSIERDRKLENLAAQARIDEIRVVALDDWFRANEQDIRNGDPSSIRERISRGEVAGIVDRFVEANSAHLKTPEQRARAKAELTQALATSTTSMLGTARQSAIANDAKARIVSHEQNLGEVARERDDIGGALAFRFTQSVERIRRSLDGGAITQEEHDIEIIRYGREFAAQAMESIAAVAEQHFTNSGYNAQSTEALLKNLQANVMPVIEQVSPGESNNRTRQINDWIQAYRDKGARASVSREISQWRGLRTAVNRAANNGNVEVLETLLGQADSLSGSASADPQVQREILVLTDTEERQRLVDKAQAVRVPRERARKAMRETALVPKDPASQRALDSEFTREMVRLQPENQGQRLAFTNAVIGNSGSVTPAMRNEYVAVFNDIANNPASAAVLADAAGDLAAFSPYAYGEFLDFEEGRLISRFVTHFTAEVASARTQLGRELSDEEMGNIVQSSYKTANDPVPTEVIRDRRQWLDSQDGKAVAADVVRKSLPGYMEDALAGTSFSAGDFFLSQQGVNGEVYRFIVAKAGEYYMHGPTHRANWRGATVPMTQAERMEAAMKQATASAMKQYQWNGREFVRDSPLSMGSGPADHKVIQNDILDRLAEFGADRDDPNTRRIVEGAQYLGNDRDGWILYYNNRVVTAPDGTPFVYTGFERK